MFFYKELAKIRKWTVNHYFMISIVRTLETILLVNHVNFYIRSKHHTRCMIKLNIFNYGDLNILYQTRTFLDTNRDQLIEHVHSWCKTCCVANKKHLSLRPNHYFNVYYRMKQFTKSWNSFEQSCIGTVTEWNPCLLIVVLFF